ncbi:hypothetical protein IFVP182_C260103 [Vibrio parahaemolyticus]
MNETDASCWQNVTYFVSVLVLNCVQLIQFSDFWQRELAWTKLIGSYFISYRKTPH